jgi:hypothetical protein
MQAIPKPEQGLYGHDRDDGRTTLHTPEALRAAMSRRD